MYFRLNIRQTPDKLLKKSGRKDAGFTLIEMMMVLLIIGVMSTAVLLTIPDRKPAAQEFSEKLVRDLNLAAQNSLLSGQPAGFGLTRDGYVIYAYADEAWAQSDAKNWPDNVSIRFEKDNRRLELPREALPLIIFEPTGQSGIFRLTLRDGEQSFDLHSVGDGRIKIGVPS
ncbi:MAG: GspH/FimT family pseudopilin [Litorimonas sp.]